VTARTGNLLDESAMGATVVLSVISIRISAEDELLISEEKRPNGTS
jgi:hypothetical protein